MWDNIMPGVWQITATGEPERDPIEVELERENNLSLGFTKDELMPLEERLKFAYRLKEIRERGVTL